MGALKAIGIVIIAAVVLWHVAVISAWEWLKAAYRRYVSPGFETPAPGAD
jgi:hypothetical protein